MKILEVDNYSSKPNKFTSIKIDKNLSFNEYEYLYKETREYRNYGENVAKRVNIERLNLQQIERTNLFDVMIIQAFHEQYGLVLSPKALNIFLNHRITNYQLIDINFTNVPELNGYKWIYFLQSDNYIDFVKTFKNNPFGYEVTNEEEFIQFRKSKDKILKNKYLDLRKTKEQEIKYEYFSELEMCYLSKNVFETEDLIKFKFDHQIYISEKLMDSLKNENITGVSFKDFDIKSRYIT